MENREKPSDLEVDESLGVFPVEEFVASLSRQENSAYIVTFTTVLSLCQKVREQGGRALMVGGSVRDWAMGKLPKDFDLEVYGLELPTVEEIAAGHGRSSEVGKSFGVIKLFTEKGFDIDLSLPRRDSKIGPGHRGIGADPNPFLTIREAATRRDFTMNALAADPLTRELFDYFGGLQDIRNRVLRVTDHERFRDDPLRVLRALQFIGRFGLCIDEESVPVLQDVISSLNELPKERIGEEWKKLLLKSEKPSIGLSAGMFLGVLHKLHPELISLAETPQEKDWHPEGDVWVHTLMSVDEAAKIVRRERLDEDQSLTIILATLCHDLGKPLVTKLSEEGRLISHGHEQAGAEPTKKFLARLGIEGTTRDKVVNLVTDHLTPTHFFIEEVVREHKISDRAIRHLAQRIHPATIRELVLVSEADHLGRGQFEDVESPEASLLPPTSFPAGEWLLQRARVLEVESSRPIPLTRGADWINLGFKQGVQMGELIKISDLLRDDGYTREMVFQAVAGIEKIEEVIAKLKSLVQD